VTRFRLVRFRLVRVPSRAGCFTCGFPHVRPPLTPAPIQELSRANPTNRVDNSKIGEGPRGLRAAETPTTARRRRPV